MIDSCRNHKLFVFLEAVVIYSLNYLTKIESDKTTRLYTKTIQTSTKHQEASSRLLQIDKEFHTDMQDVHYCNTAWSDRHCLSYNEIAIDIMMLDSEASSKNKGRVINI